MRVHPVPAHVVAGVGVADIAQDEVAFRRNRRHQVRLDLDVLHCLGILLK